MLLMLELVFVVQRVWSSFVAGDLVIQAYESTTLFRSPSIYSRSSLEEATKSEKMMENTKS